MVSLIWRAWLMAWVSASSSGNFLVVAPGREYRQVVARRQQLVQRAGCDHPLRRRPGQCPRPRADRGADRDDHGMRDLTLAQRQRRRGRWPDEQRHQVRRLHHSRERRLAHLGPDRSGCRRADHPPQARGRAGVAGPRQLAADPDPERQWLETSTASGSSRCCWAKGSGSSATASSPPTSAPEASTTAHRPQSACR